MASLGALSIVAQNSAEDKRPVAPNDDDPDAPQIIFMDGNPGPGKLLVTIREGAGFSVPGRKEEILDQERSSPVQWEIFDMEMRFKYPWLDMSIYAILEFDNSQVFVDAFIGRGTPERPVWMGHKTSPCKFDVSQASELVLYFYLTTSKGSAARQDLFLGMARMTPSFDEGKPSSADWLPLQVGNGKIRVGVDFVKTGTFRNEDMQRLYAVKTYAKSDITSWCGKLRAQVNNPFIASIKFAFQTSTKLHLHSPEVDGGYLFYYLQMERRFDINRSRIYIAEMICALEYLHEHNISYDGPSPKNILLSSSGHVVLCDFNIYLAVPRRTDRAAGETPAPEVVPGGPVSRMTHWWILGAFLHEMLTGLPPFYNGSAGITGVQQNSLLQPLQLSDSVPHCAKDILDRMLRRQPEQRLGVNGASEIKSHAFFESIDWNRLARREYEPAFKPPRYTPVLNGSMIFKQDPYPNYADEAREFLQMIREFDFPANRPANVKIETVQNPPGRDSVSGDDGDKLTTTLGGEAPGDDMDECVSRLTALPIPSRHYPRKGHALIKAAETGDEDLVGALVQDSDRVACTSALCWAVDQQDTAMSRFLLEKGAKPDFEESDKPRRPITSAEPQTCSFGSDCVDEDYTPPLVRAASMGNVNLVRLLLAHNANANSSYHDLSHLWRPGRMESGYQVNFLCGRVVQLAMELGHRDIVQLLLDSGADASGPQQFSVVGECMMTPREVYLRVTADLRAVQAAKG